MTEKDLLKMIHQREGQNLEFKSNFNEACIETLVAFSNASGGMILIGVEDKGNITGVSIGKESIARWLNEIKIKTEYKIIPEVQILEIKSKIIVLLKVNEYPSKPISYKGRYYKRINESNHTMTTDEIVNEYLMVRNKSWDMFLAEGYTVEYIDLEKVVKLIQKINKKREINIEEDPLLFLKKYGLIQDIKITNAALLLFAKGELDITELQIGLFETDTVIKKSITIKEDLFREVDMVMDFIMTHITKEYIFTGAPERDERWQYPLSAVREFVINAIIHRDYRRGVHSQFKVFRDKIELWNTGKLPEELKIKDLFTSKEKSIPRNIKIAEIFKEAYLIEKYGGGIKRATEEMGIYNLPTPWITETAGGLNVVLFGEEEPLPGSNHYLTMQERNEAGKNSNINSILRSRRSSYRRK
jgi:ATP-dependent DNA helicase RecG